MLPKFHSSVIPNSIIVWSALVVPALAADWPQFLGPDRNGHSTEVGLVDRIDDQRPIELWRQPMVGGMSGIAVVDGRLLTLSQSEGKQWLMNLDASTGKMNWKTPLADEFQNAMGHGPRSTPTVAGERVFAYTGEGILVAVGLADGQIHWSVNLPLELKCKIADYGMACSPLAVDTMVIVHVGSQEGAVVALDQKTGDIRWKAGADAAGYSSPVLMTLHGKKQIVSFLGGQVLGIEPKGGQVLWSYPFQTEYYCNTACPIAVGDAVLISAGENHGTVLLKLETSGDSWTVSEGWKTLGTSSSLRSEWQTPILIDGALYGFDNSGSAGPVTHLVCLDAKTGKQQWKQLRFGKGNCIAADGKLIVTTTKGEIILVQANDQAFEELGRKTVIGFTRQAPALSNGKLYLRDDAEIVCLDFRKPH